MDETETTVAGSQNDQVQQTDENKGQTHGQKPIGENQPERIHDDRVFRFRTGIRH